MTWTPNPSIASRIASSRAAASTIGSSFRMLGATVSDTELLGIIRHTLAIPDDAPTGEITRIIAGTLHMPLQVPRPLEPSLSTATMAADDALLARHLGVDPLRLLLAGSDAVAMVTRGAMTVRAIPKWRDAALEHVDMSFKLARDVTWRGGRLTVRGGRLPHALTDAMVGRRLDSVHDESWDGWKRLVVQSAAQTASTVTFDTGRQERVTLATLGAGAEGL